MPKSELAAVEADEDVLRLHVTMNDAGRACCRARPVCTVTITLTSGTLPAALTEER